MDTYVIVVYWRLKKFRDDILIIIAVIFVFKTLDVNVQKNVHKQHNASNNYVNIT